MALTRCYRQGALFFLQAREADAGAPRAPRASARLIIFGRQSIAASLYSLYTALHQLKCFRFKLSLPTLIDITCHRNDVYFGL